MGVVTPDSEIVTVLMTADVSVPVPTDVVISVTLGEVADEY